jgi:hypothetical protein
VPNLKDFDIRHLSFESSLHLEWLRTVKIRRTTIASASHAFHPTSIRAVRTEIWGSGFWVWDLMATTLYRICAGRCKCDVLITIDVLIRKSKNKKHHFPSISTIQNPRSEHKKIQIHIKTMDSIELNDNDIPQNQKYNDHPGVENFKFLIHGLVSDGSYHPNLNERKIQQLFDRINDYFSSLDPPGRFLSGYEKVKILPKKLVEKKIRDSLWKEWTVKKKNGEHCIASATILSVPNSKHVFCSTHLNLISSSKDDGSAKVLALWNNWKRSKYASGK